MCRNFHETEAIIDYLIVLYYVSIIASVYWKVVTGIIALQTLLYYRCYCITGIIALQVSIFILSLHVFGSLMNECKDINKYNEGMSVHWVKFTLLQEWKYLNVIKFNKIQ